jgi:hypothetical protein
MEIERGVGLEPTVKNERERCGPAPVKDGRPKNEKKRRKMGKKMPDAGGRERSMGGVEIAGERERSGRRWLASLRPKAPKQPKITQSNTLLRPSTVTGRRERKKKTTKIQWPTVERERDRRERIRWLALLVGGEKAICGGRCSDGWRGMAVGGTREEGKYWGKVFCGKKAFLKILGKSCV